MTNRQKDIVTIQELADLLGVHRRTISRRMEEGLPHLRVGWQIRFELGKTLQWFEKDMQKGREKAVRAGKSHLTF